MAPELRRPATLAVALGGAVGTAARAGLGLAFAATAAPWPWSTFLANLLGAFLLGAVLGRADRGRPPAWWHGPGVTTGALGAFTTFSALTVETLAMAPAWAAAYAGATLAAGLTLAAAGWRVGRGPAPRGARLARPRGSR